MAQIHSIARRAGRNRGCRIATSPAVWISLAGIPTTISAALAPGWTYERTLVAHGQWWRLFSGYLTHWSPSHFFLNILTLILLAALAGERQPRAHWVLFGACTCSLVLWYGMPSVVQYRGSSPLVAMFLPAALLALWQRSRSAQVAALLLAGAFAAKIAIDAAGLDALSSLPLGVRSTWELHLAGFASGVASLALKPRRLLQRRRSSRPSS